MGEGGGRGGRVALVSVRVIMSGGQQGAYCWIKKYILSSGLHFTAKSGGWCLASFVGYVWSVRFVILFPGVVSGGERKGLYYSVSCCGVRSWFLAR